MPGFIQGFRSGLGGYSVLALSDFIVIAAHFHTGASEKWCRLDEVRRLKCGGGGVRQYHGAVCASSQTSQCSACSRLVPHISSLGWSEPHTAGRSGAPKSLQPSVSSSWMQRSPAGLPFSMPGIGLLMEGSMQQAAQLGRQFMG